MIKRKAMREKISKLEAFYEKNKKVIWVFVAIFGLWFLIRKIGRKIPEHPTGNVAVPVKSLPSKGATLSDGQANSYAERLYDAMRISGTDEEAIFAILKNLSTADYNKIYNAFGLRSYLPFLGESPFFVFKWGAKELSLTQWLVEELSSAEFAKLKKLNPNLPI